MVSKGFLVLLEGNTEAVKKIISVSCGEHGAISEASSVGSTISVVLNSLDNVSKTLLLELLLGNQSVDIVALDGNAPSGADLGGGFDAVRQLGCVFTAVVNFNPVL